MIYGEFLAKLGDQNTEEIQSFSEGDTPESTPKDIKNAEEDVKKEQEDSEEERADNDKGTSAEKENNDSESDDLNSEDYSDEEMAEMSLNQILQIRFLPRFEYGSPSGIDTSPNESCPGCNDAGDIAIIDSEVAPAEGTEEKQESSSDAGDIGDMGEGEEDNLGEDMPGLYKELKEYMILSEAWESNKILGTAGIGDMIGHLVGVVKYIMLKAAKYARLTYLFCRKHISHSLMKATTISKLWKFKINRSLSSLSEERLGEFEVEAFPYDVWIDACKVGIECFNVVRNAERIVFDNTSEATTSMMKSFSSHLENIGISITPNRRRINMDNLLDKRKFGSVTSLGYTKSQLPNCIRYLEDMSKCMPKGEKIELENILNHCMEKSGAYALQVNQSVEKGEISKNSQEYKNALDNVLKHTVRLDFLMMVMRTAYLIFDRCISDCEKVFSKVEDACSFKSIVD